MDLVAKTRAAHDGQQFVETLGAVALRMIFDEHTLHIGQPVGAVLHHVEFSAFNVDLQKIHRFVQPVPQTDGGDGQAASAATLNASGKTSLWQKINRPVFDPHGRLLKLNIAEIKRSYVEF